MSYPTRLWAKPIGSTTDAAQHLGIRDIRNGAEYVPVVLQPIRPLCSFHLIIPKGFIALVNSHGRYIGQWKPGFYIAPPWVTISHLVPTQHIIYDTPVKECPTQDNVMVTIDVALVLNIITDNEEKLYNFCYKLGPRGLDEMLKAFQEEAIRGMARKRKYTEIYDLMETKSDKQLDTTLRDLNNHFNQYGVIISEISVTNVHLPKEFSTTMQEATVWHNRNEFKLLEQEYEMRKIDTRERETKSKQKAKEDLEKFRATKEKEVAESSKKLQKVKADTNKVLAEINESQKSDVLQITSENKLVVAKINALKDIELSKIRSQTNAEVNKIRTDADLYVKLKLAEANKIVTDNGAKVTKINSESEKFSIVYLKAKRDFEEKMRALQTMKGLGNNRNISIVGNNHDNILAQLAANQRNGLVLGINAQ